VNQHPTKKERVVIGSAAGRIVPCPLLPSRWSTLSDLLAATSYVCSDFHTYTYNHSQTITSRNYSDKDPEHLQKPQLGQGSPGLLAPQCQASGSRAGGIWTG